MYNDLWGSSSRGHSDNTEVLIGADGTVEQISRRSTFPFEVPDGKTILQVNGIGETFIDAHCPIGSKVQITSQVLPDRNWKFLVGGHALLADNGHMVPYYKDLSSLAGTRARTAAAGFSGWENPLAHHRRRTYQPQRRRATFDDGLFHGIPRRLARRQSRRRRLPRRWS